MKKQIKSKTITLYDNSYPRRVNYYSCTVSNYLYNRLFKSRYLGDFLRFDIDLETENEYDINADKAKIWDIFLIHVFGERNKKIILTELTKR